jgi:hypothetical protein
VVTVDSTLLGSLSVWSELFTHVFGTRSDQGLRIAPRAAFLVTGFGIENVLRKDVDNLSRWLFCL